MIEIITRRHQGVLDRGEEQDKTYYSWTTGPRNLIAAMDKLGDHEAAMVLSLGNVGHVKSWIVVDGVAVQMEDRMEYEYNTDPGNFGDLSHIRAISKTEWCRRFIAAVREKNNRSVAAATMGRNGGASKSPAKASAARENGRTGGRPPKYTYDDGYVAHLGVTGDRTCIIPDQVAADQKAFDGKSFPAIIEGGYNHGKQIRVRLNGDDYDLHGSGTGDTVVRPV